MKKIALMSGAYVNAGDFLIEQRCQELLKHFVPDAEIHVLKRDVSYNDKIDELKQYNLIVFGGGPGYQKKMYPHKMPFISNLNYLNVPVTIMGWGWKGKRFFNDIYKNTLSQSTIAFLKFVEKCEIPLGCRDWYTLDFLKSNKIYNTLMTGCPAWYDLQYINNLNIRKEFVSEEKMNICISDPAIVSNKPILLPLIVFIRQRYPVAKIQLIFHQGITSNDKLYITRSFLQKYNLTILDISGSSKGFQIYNKCSLHIGFRVHAHIYNLSHGNISILINEDMRGKGVNDALGIRNINLNTYKKFSSMNSFLLIRALDDYLHYLNASKNIQYINACKNIQFYYKAMGGYLSILKEIV